MKVRSGFVSNSSSSSFIVGIAKIKDYAKLQQYLKENGISLSYDVQVLTLMDIQNSNAYNARVNSNSIVVDSFQTDARISSEGFTNDDLFLVVDKCNDEGDSAFYSNDDYDIDYDIDLSWFDPSDRKLYKAFFDNESGLDVDKSDARFGAGRNG